MSGQLAQMVRAKHPGAYDDLSDEELEKAITAKYPGTYDDLVTPAQQTQPPPPPMHPHARTTQAVGNALKGAWNVVSEIPAGIKQLVTDPIGSVQMMGQAQGQLAYDAQDAFRQGDYVKAVRKGINYALPIVGPMIDPSADKMMEGNIMEGAGEVVTNAALLAAGMRPKAPPKTRAPRLAPPANPKDAAAVAFAKQEGIPLDAATATGNQMLRKVQKKVESSYGGSGTADELRSAQAQHLERVGLEQADRVAPKATNPVAAGEGVRNVLTKQIQDLHKQAGGAYDVIRAMEEAQRKALPKSADKLAQMDVTARTPLAVDITQAVKELQPLYNQLKRESELGIPMHGSKGRTLAALDGLMNSPNVASLTVVDGALSDLKALARGADMPELRSTGQAAAAQAVAKLDAQVRTAAAKAGPNVLKALEEGRKATTQKYAVAEVLDMLSGEPGQVFRQLTQNKDVGLERLRAVQQHAPKEMENIGRAFLEDAMQQATAEGGFMHADRLWANWQKLGPQTKKMLFSKPGQIEALDNFFLIAKRIKENPNPSGTATIPKLNVTEALAGIPAWALSKMLMTPNGVKWLTTARMASRTPSRATRALAASQITKAAQSAGVPLDVIPAFSGESETPTPLGTRR